MTRTRIITNYGKKYSKLILLKLSRIASNLFCPTSKPDVILLEVEYFGVLQFIIVTLYSSEPSLKFRQQCKDVTEDDLTDTQYCANVPCPHYEWDVGEWTACLTQNNGN